MLDFVNSILSDKIVAYRNFFVVGSIMYGHRTNPIGPILFKIFINDLIYIFEDENIFNFADDNTLTAIRHTVSQVVENLEIVSKKTI